MGEYSKGVFADGKRTNKEAHEPPLQVLTSALSRSFCLKRQDKVLEEEWFPLDNACGHVY